MITRQNPAALKALASLLLLVQLPHLMHLPVWVSTFGVVIVTLRLLAERHPHNRALAVVLSPLVLTAIALLSAGLIRAYYGYLLGRDPCVAFLFLLVAAKFAEYRRASDATVLLCLAAFLLLTQYFYTQSIFSALVTLPAVFALGNALAVLRDPERAHTTGRNLRLVAGLLLQGAPLAALLFMVFPRLPGPLWSMPEDSLGRTGLSDSMMPGSISSLSQSDAVAFRVEFDTQPPSPAERYWRGPVLSDFDGQRWTVARRQRLAAPPEGADSRLAYTVMLQPNHRRWLFALEQAAGLPVGPNAEQTAGRPLAQLTSNGQLIAAEPVTQILRYRQLSGVRDRYPASTPAPSGTLQLPGNNARTLAFAAELRANSASDADYARAVLNHFNRQPYRYTLRPRLLGNDPVDEFLFDTREGFCEHYASAFVVLMRAAGIAARVVTGYLGGEMNGDYMIVRQSDAHAWAEALIGGHWQRFDPTGAVAPSRVDTGLDAALADDEPVPRMARLHMGWVKRLQLGWDSLNHDWQRLVVDFDNSSQHRLLERLGLGTPAIWQSTAAVLAVALLWGISLLAWPGRRPREPEAERLWRELCNRLGRHGIDRRPSETPQAFIERAAGALPSHATAIAVAGRAFGVLRFAKLSEAERARRLHALRLHLRPLMRSLWWQRMVSGPAVNARG